MSKEDKNNKKKSKETDTNTKKTNRKKTPSTKVIKKENNKNIEEEKVIVKEKIPEKKKYNKDDNDKKATTFNFVEVIIIMIISAVFGAFVSSCVVYFTKNSKHDELKLENKDLNEFVSTYNDLLNEYYMKLDKDKLLEAGIKGMINYLGDPYSNFMDAEQADDFNQEVEGNFVGMGVEIQKQKDKGIVIVTIFDGSPAKKSGFELGDIIVKVDDKDVSKMDVSEVAKLIKGEEGTKVNVTVKRNDKEMTMEVTRETIEIPSVSSKVIEQEGKKVGYIRMSIFAQNTASQFETHLKKLKKEKIDSLIIDVRGNSGGYLTVVTEIASRFLDKKDVIYQLETKGTVKKVHATNVEKTKLPLVVLIDGGSASASEILASSLKENNKAKLIGVKSYGKGTVQKAYSLKSGATIKYTIQSWLTPKGNKIDKVGVKPDIEVKLDKKYLDDPSEKNDNQLQAAIKELLKNNK